MEFVLEQTPVAKARARHARIGGRIITFDPQKSLNLADKGLILQIMRQNGLEMALPGPIYTSVVCFCPMPTSWSQKRRIEMEGKWCATKPDIDNYIKRYFDLLNGIAYEDDRFICKTVSEKRYSANPRVEILIEQLS